MLSGVFCFFLLPISQRTVFLSALPGRLLLSNKPSCRISVFFLAFQNVKIVKLLNVTQMKLLGMKFSKRTTIFVTYLCISGNSAGKPHEPFYLFSQEGSSPIDCVDKCLVCCVSLLIMKAKPVKLFKNQPWHSSLP